MIVKSLIINSLISKLSTINSLAIKHDIDKLLAIRFIQLIEEATWLSPIVVVPKKNGKLIICVDFMKLNKAKKNPCPLPFFYEILNTIVGFIFKCILWISSNFYSP